MNTFEKDVLALLDTNKTNYSLNDFIKKVEREGSKCLPILNDNEFTIKFYQKHKHEINDFLYHYFINYTNDYNTHDFEYIKGFDSKDPLVLESNNQHLITTIAIEAMINEISEDRGLEL